MATTPTLESGESPGPAPISEPIRDSVPAKARAASDAVPPRPGLARRLLSALHGDKHMVDAYPPPKER
jgi:hypothetical protein